jgi:TetR/AcrR family transcriptional repressor of nem operon
VDGTYYITDSFAIQGNISDFATQLMPFLCPHPRASLTMIADIFDATKTNKACIFKTTGRILRTMLKTTAKHLTKEKLLDRGVALFTEQGYHGVGLQDILTSVGVPKGSFYNYFASKEEFGAAAIAHYLEPFIEKLDGWLKKPELDGRAALEGYFGELIEELEKRGYAGGCLLGNLIGEVGDTSETCRLALTRAVHRYRDKLKEGIVRGQREGVFRTDLEAEAMADFLSDAWQGALLRMKIEQSVRPLQACCNYLLRGYFQA